MISAISSPPVRGLKSSHTGPSNISPLFNKSKLAMKLKFCTHKVRPHTTLYARFHLSSTHIVVCSSAQSSILQYILCMQQKKIGSSLFCSDLGIYGKLMQCRFQKYMVYSAHFCASGFNQQLQIAIKPLIWLFTVQFGRNSAEQQQHSISVAKFT